MVKGWWLESVVARLLGGSLISRSHSLNNPKQQFSNPDDEDILLL